MKKLFALALLGAAAAGTRLVADEGRIPISTPTTITKSGHYIVTRDLFINGPGSILAIGNNHVTIDLNGFSLQSLNGTDPVIRSLGGFGSLTIRNGTVEGGSAGILFPAGGTRVVIEGVLVTGADQDGIRLNGVNDFAIRRSIISIHHLDGIHVEAGNGYSEVVGTIENNLVEDCGGSGIEILDGSGVGVVGNRIRGTDQGIALVAPAGCLISDNTVVAARGDGIFIFDDLTRGGAHGGNRLSGNAVSGSGSVGIAIGGIETGGSSTGNFVINNTITRSSSAGLAVHSGLNQIEDNVMTLNGDVGLWLGGNSFKNVYRRNTARGNQSPSPCAIGSTPDFCDAGAKNTSAGDNFLPDPQ